MAQPLLIAHPENATIEELKQVSRLGSNETVTRCSAIQMILAGADRQLVCNALLVNNRALRKWINRFNQCGVGVLIVKKRPGRMAIIDDQQAPQLAQLIDQPQQAQRSFWTAKAFHGQCLMAQTQNNQLAQPATDVFAALFTRSQPPRAHLADDQSTLVQQPCL